MAVSEDHASFWVHKELTVTTKNNEALLTASRASGKKDKSTVSGTTERYRAGTLDGQKDQEVTASKAQSQRVMFHLCDNKRC